MINLKKVLENNISKDILITIILGLISGALGLIKLDTPGFEGSYSDLRELGLLICLFHLRNPLFIIPLCIISMIGLPLEIRLAPIFIMHVIPLLITWHIYKWIQYKSLSTLKLGLAWFTTAVVYYALLLYPLLILTYGWFEINPNESFIDSYQSLFSSGTLEMISTALGTSFYLVQLNIRRSLIRTNKNLESIVQQRTQELTDTNNELKLLNENLEDMVIERTQKINNQLTQMIKYAHMNSHEVRAPLARILGLLQLMETETDNNLRQELLKKINEGSVELDEIIKKMNRILEEEIAPEESNSSAKSRT